MSYNNYDTNPGITNTLSNVASNVSNVASNVSNVASNVASGITNVASNVASGVSSVGVAAGDTLRSVSSNYRSATQDFFNSNSLVAKIAFLLLVFSSRYAGSITKKELFGNELI